MERRRLGRAGLAVPVVGMGTWQTFDTREGRRDLVEAALAAGVDLFDSSPMYGRAEETLAAAIEHVRPRVQVATKVWTPDAAEGRRQVARALKLFGHVDVYQVHNLLNVADHLTHLEALKASGEVRAVGITDYRESSFGEMARWMATGRIDVIQIPYSPLRQSAAQELVPLAESLGVGVFVLSPLRDGILDRRPSSSQLASLGVQTWAQAVLKWIVSDPRVSAVLTATHRPQRVAENAAAGDAPLLTDEQRELVVKIAEQG